ncbi:MAG: DUF4440 domain-containing protein [Chitinophagaceae bacterium]|nr:DUF4440 domain-containing protein [Chitinophagaceae bacterium]
MRFILLLGISLMFIQQISAQSFSGNGVREADSLMWDAYNRCDVDGMKVYFTEDIEFYHDKGGVTIGVDSLATTFRKGPCSNTDSFRLRRAVVPQSIKIYPLYQNNRLYGAVFIGEHLFFITEKGKTERVSGQAKFTHLWLLQNGAWKIKRVLSYDHQAVAAESPSPEKKPVISVPNAILKEYVGRYQNNKSGTLLVQSSKGYLIVTSGNLVLKVYPSSYTLFSARDRDLSFEFLKKAAGIIDVVVRENGTVVETYSASRR